MSLIPVPTSNSHVVTVDFGSEIDLLAGLGEDLRGDRAKAYFIDALGQAAAAENISFSTEPVADLLGAAAGLRSQEDRFIAGMLGEAAEMTARFGGSVTPVNGASLIDRPGFLNLRTGSPGETARLLSATEDLIRRDHCLLRHQLCDVIFWNEALKYPPDGDLRFAERFAEREVLGRMPHFEGQAVLDDFRDEIPDRTLMRIAAFAPGLDAEWARLRQHPHWSGDAPIPRI